MKPVLRIVLLAALTASVLAAQIGLSFLPNVELVSLLLLIYAIHLPFKDALMVGILFAVLEALVWGFGDWVVGYMWIWPLWMIMARLLAPLNKDSSDRWAIAGGVWGLLFGFLFSIQHAVLYGFTMGIAYWLRGISFDIIHAVSNYILILLLYKPLSLQFERLYQRLEGTYGRNDKNRR